MNNHLPVHPCLDIKAFSNIFENTSTSYKFLFFLSLLQKLKETGKTDNAVTEITFIDIAVEMLLIAWFPHQYFKLSLGVQDQSAIILEKFIKERKIIFEKGPITHSTVGHLRMELLDWLNEDQNNVGSLLDYVPYRLLTPFYSKELKGLPEHKKNKKIKELVKSHDKNIALYFFTENSIQVDAIWREYILKNIRLIEGWAKWNWCEYLQNRNPSVPAVPKKILPVLQRVSMTKEIKYWQNILEHRDLKCIYSDEVLDDFELDHFLPWTFVAHNQLWNLIPVLGAANASKSNNLPNLNNYFDCFVEEQFISIQTAKEIYTENKWIKFMQPYISDLHITSYDDLLNQSVVEKAFKHTIMPLYEIASTNGFSTDWTYLEKQDKKADIIKKLTFVSEIEEEHKYISYLPLYPIEIAAGNFIDSEVVEEPSAWLDMSKTDFHSKLEKRLFITKIKGHSMEPTIPDGSYCIFKYGVIGSRINRIVLAKKDGVLDSDLQTSFTVKRYFSEKIANKEHGWTHSKIELRPDNPDYNVIEINQNEVDDFSIVAEFVQVLE